MKKGITLVELMILVAIVGLVLAIAVPTYCKARDTTKINKLGLKCSGAIGTGNCIYYSLDTKCVVELDEDLITIKRTIGKITVPITIFEDLSLNRQREVIEYFSVKTALDNTQINIMSNSINTITVNGVKYIKAEN